jgi:hypothetical protein
MKIKFLYLALAVSLVFGSVSIAAAEPALTTILNGAYGDGHYKEETTTNDYLLKPASYTTVTIHTEIDDHQAGYVNPTGWYAPGATPVLHQLFDAPLSGETQDFTTNDKFGIYIKSNEGNIYSQNSLNTRKLVKLFYIDKDKNGQYDDNCYAFAFEDILGSNSDNDYQDVVIEVSSKDTLTLVPEFPTVAVPVAAVLGLLLIFGRKNEKL